MHNYLTNILQRYKYSTNEWQRLISNKLSNVFDLSVNKDYS